MAYRVRTFYIDARTMSAAEKDRDAMGVAIPEGWEPIGGEIETGGALRLVLARDETDREREAFRFKGERGPERVRRTNGELDD